MTAIHYYPDEQIDALWNYLNSNPESPCQISSKEELRKTLFMLTSTNKICIHCSNEKAESYITCTECDIYHYCSDKCLTNDKEIHKNECRNNKLPQNKIRYGARFGLMNLETGTKMWF